MRWAQLKTSSKVLYVDEHRNMAVVKEIKQKETLKKKVHGIEWERKADVKQNKSKCQNGMYKDQKKELTGRIKKNQEW